MRLGRYIVEDLPLGGGGMATVHRARLTGPDGFERSYAAKRIVSDRAQDKGFRQLFAREAKIAARLSHANVVSVHDYGEADDGTSFIIMELVEGKDLSAVMREAARRARPLPVELSLYLVAETLQGLHYAHELRDARGKRVGVIHRDLSPHNVLLSWFGEVKVTDFGIAKVREAQAQSARTLRGKITYMSPEQASMQDVDQRSDVFSAGIVLWELLTGARLYGQGTEQEALVQAARGVVPRPSTVNPALPPAVEAVCMRLLAPTREGRYPDAASAMRAIAELAEYPRAGQFQLAEFLVQLFPAEAPALVETLRNLGAAVLAATVAPNLGPTVMASGGDVTRTRRPSTPPLPALPAVSGVAPRQRRGRGARRARWLLPLAALCAAGAALALYLGRHGKSGAGAAARAGAGQAVADAGPLADDASAGPVAVPVPLAVAVDGGARAAAPDAAPAVEVGHPQPRHGHPELPVPVPGPPVTPPAPLAAAPDAGLRLAGEGIIKVAVKPWATVYIDDRRIGSAPQRVKVAAGPHTVTIENDDHHEDIPVVVTSGEIIPIERTW